MRPLASHAAPWISVEALLHLARAYLGMSDPAGAQIALREAEQIDWSGDPWHELADKLKASTGRKGRGLFRPLRIALTGRESGPEMGPLLKLIGKERALERLSAAAQ